MVVGLIFEFFAIFIFLYFSLSLPSGYQSNSMVLVSYKPDVELTSGGLERKNFLKAMNEVNCEVGKMPWY